MTQSDFLEKFLRWEGTIRKDLLHVGAMMREPLSDQPEILFRDLEAIEAWNARIGLLSSEAGSWLDQARHIFLPNRDDKTELDRKVELDSMVSQVKAVKVRIENLMDAIKHRLSLGQSILAYMRNYMQPNTVYDAPKTAREILERK